MRSAAVHSNARPWLPRVRYFSEPIADPHLSRFAGGIIHTTLFARNGPDEERADFDLRAERDIQAFASFGGTLPLWRVAQWEGGGLVLGFQAGIIARFRMNVSANDLVATDWIVAAPLEIARGRHSARLRILHWSAHLGDELISFRGAEPIVFSQEAAVVLLATSPVDWLRVYAGGTAVMRSTGIDDLPSGDVRDRGEARVGAEVTFFPWLGDHAGLVAAMDWKRAERTEWRSQFSSLAGVAVGGEALNLRLVGRYFSGPSALGQFFRTHERYWGAEIALRFGGGTDKSF